jgi:chromosome segregation ATPase
MSPVRFVLATPVIDISRFYGNELARAISEIRQDFDVLSQSQLQELEEYYRVKTEHIQQTVAQETERKRLLDNTQETIDKTSRSATLADLTKDYRQLQSENSQLQGRLDDVASDFSRIQEEHLREQENQVRELNQLRDELGSKQAALDSLLGSNVSLRFELSTYRRLLSSEEQRLNQLEQEQPTILSSSSTANQVQRSPSETRNTRVTMQKMAIKKSSQGLYEVFACIAPILGSF